MKHRSSQLSDDEYFDAVVSKLCDWELPEEILDEVEEDSEDSS